MESISQEPAMVELAEDLGTMPRNRSVGYQGTLRLKKVLAIPIFLGEDGKEYVMDLSQAADSEPDLAAREWITVRGGTAGGKENVRPGGSGGTLDLFKMITGGGTGNPIADIAMSFLKKLTGR